MEHKNSLINTLISERGLCVLLLFFLLIELIPMLTVAQYDVPSADDFSYGVYVRTALRNNGSLIETLKNAFYTVRRYYYGWQGTFSAIFLMAFQPAVFGEQFYAATPYIMLASLLGGSIFFCWVLFRCCFGATRAQFLIVSAVLFSISIQLVPSAVESFYWYNGSVYYTFFYGISLIFYGVLLRYWLAQAKAKRIRNLILATFLATFIGGGNYVTVLISILIMAIGIILLVINKKKIWKMFLIPLAFLLASFAISVLAPGNTVRQANYEGFGVVRSIFASIQAALQQIQNYTTLLMLLMFAFLSPTLWKIARNAKWSFKWPLLVAILSCGLFAAEFCPAFFAMGDEGPNRLHNIIFFSYVFLAIFNLFYCFGWISHRFQIRRELSVWRMQLPVTIAAWILSFILVCFMIPRNTPFTSINAVQELYSGAAEQYYAEFQERLILLNDDNIENVGLDPYSQCPYLLYYWDVTSDPDFWSNQAMANYYEKATVCIIENKLT